MVSRNPDIMIGDFNSGLDYQPEGIFVEKWNKMKPYELKKTLVNSLKERNRRIRCFLVMPLGYQYMLDNGYVDAIQPQPLDTWCPASHANFQLCINAGILSPLFPLEIPSSFS